MPLPLIATDLDGTFLMSDSHQPHPLALAAVHQAMAAGIPFVFATGRAPIDVLEIAELVGHQYFAVCCDGTALVDLRTDSVFKVHSMAETNLREIVSRLRAKFPAVKFLVDRVPLGPITRETYGLIIEEGFKAPWATALTGAQSFADISEVLGEPDIVKICAYIPGEDVLGETFEAAKDLVGDLATSVRIQSKETFIDLCQFGISKATGVAEIAEHFAILPEDVFAVGDLHNDVAMLQWAGFSFAVSNAHPRVHDVADAVVPSNDEGGVGHVVEAAMEHLLRP